jgi:hypothetical protein
MTRAIAEIGNRVIEPQLLERAQAPGLDADEESEEGHAAAAVRAVADYGVSKEPPPHRRTSRDRPGPAETGRGARWRTLMPAVHQRLEIAGAVGNPEYQDILSHHPVNDHIPINRIAPAAPSQIVVARTADSGVSGQQVDRLVIEWTCASAALSLPLTAKT